MLSLLQRTDKNNTTMTPTTAHINPETELVHVQDLLYKLAWRCANTYPVPFEEALSEAYMIYMRACASYKPDRGAKFSTWLQFCVSLELKTFVTKRTVDASRLSFIEIDEETCGGAAQHRHPLQEWAGDLSEDAQELLSLLLETPEEVLGKGTATPLQLLRKAKYYLMTQRKKSPTEVQQAEQEIRHRLAEIWKDNRPAWQPC